MFVASLLDYVGSQAQYLHTLLAMTQASKLESRQHAQRLQWAEMALEALRNVIRNNPGMRVRGLRFGLGGAGRELGGKGERAGKAAVGRRRSRREVRRRIEQPLVVQNDNTAVLKTMKSQVSCAPLTSTSKRMFLYLHKIVSAEGKYIQVNLV